MKTYYPIFWIVVFILTVIWTQHGDINHANKQAEMQCEKILAGEWPNINNVDCGE